MPRARGRSCPSDGVPGGSAGKGRVGARERPPRAGVAARGGGAAPGFSGGEGAAQPVITSYGAASLSREVRGRTRGHQDSRR